MVGGWVGLGVWGGRPAPKPPPPTHPSSGAEFLEAPKARKKICGLNQLAPKGQEKYLDWQVGKNIAPSLFRRGGPHPRGAELVQEALPLRNYPLRLLVQTCLRRSCPIPR